MPLAEDRASVMPATRLLRFNGKSVAPCCRPVTRPVTTKRISARVSSLGACPVLVTKRTGIATSGSRRLSGTKAVHSRRRDTKTLFPFTL